MNSQLTAIVRKTASKPLAGLLETGVPKIIGPVLDYGCGRGKDVEVLNSLGIEAYGYDPFYQPNLPEGQFPTVFLFYVLNVLTKPNREEVLKQAFNKVSLGGKLIIATRTWENVLYHAKKSNWIKYEDGYLTKHTTFQSGMNVRDITALIITNIPEFGSFYPLVPATKFGKCCVQLTKLRRSYAKDSSNR